MRVLHAAVECLPFATTGGLGDVVGSLPGAQRRQGCDARILLPRYAFLAADMRDGPVIAELDVAGHRARIVESPVRANGAPVYLCDLPGLFDRGADPYRDAEGREFSDNPQRFHAFCEVAIRFAERRFDLLHLHDWHTALAAARLHQLRLPLRSVLSIHNLAFQGRLSRAEFDALNLDESIWRLGADAGDRSWSFMKAGIAGADAVSTVSPSYAREIQTPASGCGLDLSLRARAQDNALHGIVNGIDERSWNPQTDPALAQNYGISDVEAGKHANRRALQTELGLAPVNAPLVAFVGRLTDQKGADLIAEAGTALLGLEAQYVFVGVGEPMIAAALERLAKLSPHIVFREVFDPGLARRAMAAADLLLMPSRFEPCGMTQLYAQRYGTIPVVRRTGGLCDTVVDTQAATLADGTATGVQFDHADVGGLLYGLRRGLDLVRDPATLAALRSAGMSRDLSWGAASDRYRRLYEQVLRPSSLGEAGRGGDAATSHTASPAPCDSRPTTVVGRARRSTPTRPLAAITGAAP
jgi:starch synthase